MTNTEALEIMVVLLNRLALNKAEVAGVNAALAQLKATVDNLGTAKEEV